MARLRYTGLPDLLPLEVTGMDKGILLRFDVALDPAKAEDIGNYIVERWNYRRSFRYGSPHYKAGGRLRAEPDGAWSGAYLSQDAKSVFLAVPDMQTGVWQMHVGWSLASREGAKMDESAYFTPFAFSRFIPASEGFGAIAVDMIPKPIRPLGSTSASAEEGRRLYAFLGCMACHSLNDSKRYAPSWQGLFGSQVKFRDGTTALADEAYLRDHILKRSDKIVDGYENGMPNYSGIVTDGQVESLILFIKTLR